MKRSFILLFSSIAVIAVFFVSSAFKKDKKATKSAASALTKDKAPKQTVYEHFQFIGSSYNEADFENDANWISLGTTNPTTNPCTSGSSRICVVAVDQSQLSTNPLLTLPEKMELFLVNQASADTYVNNNWTYQKP
jgi:hypothetical protein